MSEVQLKLRFQITSPLQKEELVNLLKCRMTKNLEEIHGPVLRDHATINLPIKQQSICSPQLSLDFNQEESGTVIKGAFGPKPSIWLFFMFVYIVCGFVITFGGIIGISQLSMDKATIALYPIPFCLLISAGVYYASVYGKRKSRPQMVDLMNYILKTLELD